MNHTPSVNPRPFQPVSPGEILQEEIDARGWTRKQTAEHLGISTRSIGELCNGRKCITAEIALALAEALKTSPEFWMNLETNYRLDLARNRRRAAG